MQKKSTDRSWCYCFHIRNLIRDVRFRLFEQLFMGLSTCIYLW